MGTNQNGVSGSAAELEQVIAQRRAHLAATVDELVVRAQPKAIAARSVADARQRLTAVTHTEDGALRTQRLAAIGAAVLAVITTLSLIRRRANRRRADRAARYSD
ncbi:MAG: DUF3618 domain-containing protein [Kineosporiaceae bacterium]|nr:DUF3618 domain-containing protein [Kineosporiaceae bacterium]